MGGSGLIITVAFSMASYYVFRHQAERSERGSFKTH